MRTQDFVRRFPPIRKLSTAFYYYRQARWRLHPRYRIDDPATPIDRPVYLLGTQGGGLTFTSRILRRDPRVVSASGNCRYWAGADETQNVMAAALPETLTWRDVRLPGFPDPDHNWVYACDAYLPYYRGTAEQATPKMAAAYRRILRGLLRMNAPPSVHRPGRFVDKSQSLTVRVGLVRKLLEGCGPRFVLITRNPYAMCWRAVTRDRVVAALPVSEAERLDVAVQHWRNSMQCALDDAAEDLRWWRFEDLLREPERVVSDICSFIGLPFDPVILPGPDDVIPWGSMFDAFDTSKWYPLRPRVSDRYLSELPDWARERVRAECGSLAERFGYDPSGAPERASHLAP